MKFIEMFDALKKSPKLYGYNLRFKRTVMLHPEKIYILPIIQFNDNKLYFMTANNTKDHHFFTNGYCPMDITIDLFETEDWQVVEYEKVVEMTQSFEILVKLY